MKWKMNSVIGLIFVFFSSINAYCEAIVNVFDFDDYSLKSLSISVKSMDVWVDPEVRKISESEYIYEGNCGRCTYARALVHYGINLELLPGLTLEFPGHFVSWSVGSSSDRNFIMPEFVSNKDLGHEKVVTEVGDKSARIYNLISKTARNEIWYDKKVKLCFRQKLLGNYTPSNMKLFYLRWEKVPVNCPK